jgi:S-adenosylmethionine synthetase
MIYPSTSTKNAKKILFSSESVTQGHPDKVCDQISDAILDAFLEKDPESRVACEVIASMGGIFVTGEIRSNCYVDIQKVVRETLKDIGYDNPDYGICYRNCSVITSINEQSSDIAQGVDHDSKKKKEQGAGDQGLMFGYACNETKTFIPLPIYLAHAITRKLSKVRENGTLSWLRPDGKAQVTVQYFGNVVQYVRSIVVSAQHDPDVSNEVIKESIIKHVIMPTCSQYIIPQTRFFVNATGRFVIGGPAGDVGLTGRKIIVDTYGSVGRHGGGCFSGKDPSKVDRSAAYMARYIAKNIVAAKLATHCEVQLAYCIGIAEPISVFINTFGTCTVSELRIEEAVKKLFPLKPAQIIEHLDLKKPGYKKTAAYGHFGREDEIFTWEEINMAEDLRDELEEEVYQPSQQSQTVLL